MSTKADLLDTWCKWTGDPVHEARHRIRVLSEAGLLPKRANDLDYADLGRAILGFLASETHKDAAVAVRKYSEFRCSAHEPGGILESTISESNLLEVLVTLLHQPESIVFLRVSSNTPSVSTVVRQEGADASNNREYYFTDVSLDLPKTVFPATIIRVVYRELIVQLVADLLSTNPASTTAGSETTKAAGAPPPNGLRATPKQAAKPASVSTEQHTHTLKNRQHRRRGLPDSQSAEKVTP